MDSVLNVFTLPGQCTTATPLPIQTPEYSIPNFFGTSIGIPSFKVGELDVRDMKSTFRLTDEECKKLGNVVEQPIGTPFRTSLPGVRPLLDLIAGATAFHRCEGPGPGGTFMTPDGTHLTHLFQLKEQLNVMDTRCPIIDKLNQRLSIAQQAVGIENPRKLFPDPWIRPRPPLDQGHTTQTPAPVILK